MFANRNVQTKEGSTFQRKILQQNNKQINKQKLDIENTYLPTKQVSKIMVLHVFNLLIQLHGILMLLSTVSFTSLLVLLRSSYIYQR